MTYLKRIQIEDVSGNLVTTDGAGNLNVAIQGNVVAETSTPILANVTIASDPIDVLEFAMIIVFIYTDVDSAVDGLQIQWSTDGTNWDDADKFNIMGNIGKTFSFNTAARYMRYQYTNGGSNQSEFRLQVVAKRVYGKPSSHRIQDDISEDDDAELVKAVMTGLRPNGDFINFAGTRNGNFKTSIEEFGDTTAIDAFARLRVSNPETLFDSKQLHDNSPLFWDQSLGGSATAAHSTVNAETLMTVTPSVGDFAIRQTKMRFNYQPGKAQLLFMTFRINNGNTGVITRVGQFSGTGANNLTPNNGIWLEDNGNDWYFKVAKNGTTTESAAQTSWNIDTLDGSGDENNPSGILLDKDACQILVMDYEWLGVGRIRCGFVIDGRVIPAHVFNHANDVSFASVYMSTPNNPLRYDIQTDGTNGASLQHICSTIMSEGGQQALGVLRSIDMGITHLDANVIGTSYAMFGIRLKTTHLGVSVIPSGLSLVGITNDNFRWRLILNPTVAGTFTYNSLTNSAIEYAIGATANTVTDGTVLAGGYVSKTTNQSIVSLGEALRIGSTIAGTRDYLVLAVTPFAVNSDIIGSFSWRELL